jgi:bifunctional DNA-binding transcriptional regulator/antitoxin component of YhaV-PrlF toxin-antitoxin module
LADRLFQCVPRPKRRDFQRRDFDLFFGIAGIYAGAGGALAHFEGAEPADHYGAAFLELPRDGLADGVKRGGSGFFADAGLLGDPTEKLRAFSTRFRYPNIGISIWGKSMRTNERDQAAERPVIRKVSRGFQITLPPEFREKTRLAIGDHVRIEQLGDTLVITAVSDERQRIANELMAALAEPVAGAADIKDEEEAMRIAIEEIRRYREEQRKKSSPGK